MQILVTPETVMALGVCLALVVVTFCLRRVAKTAAGIVSAALALASPCAILILIKAKYPYSVLGFPENWRVFIWIAFGVGFALTALRADLRLVRIAGWIGLIFNSTIIRNSRSPSHLLIRLMVGAVFLSEGIQKFLFPADIGAGAWSLDAWWRIHRQQPGKRGPTPLG